MLRASAKTPNGPLIIAGLSDGNIERLKAGQPILADLKSFGVEMPGKLTIFHGTTEAEIERTLRDNGLITERTRATADPRVDQVHEIGARHEKVLIATCGLPRSGKSTWSKRQAYPVVCPDAIRLAMHGQKFYGPAEPLVWATAKLMVRSLFGAGHKHVILDATNTLRARRDEWRSSEWGLFFKPFATPREVCVGRAREGGDDELVEVIERMHAAFDPLGADEPLWP